MKRLMIVLLKLITSNCFSYDIYKVSTNSLPEQVLFLRPKATTAASNNIPPRLKIFLLKLATSTNVTAHSLTHLWLFSMVECKSSLYKLHKRLSNNKRTQNCFLPPNLVVKRKRKQRAEEGGT